MTPRDASLPAKIVGQGDAPAAKLRSLFGPPCADLVMVRVLKPVTINTPKGVGSNIVTFKESKLLLMSH